MRLIRWKAIAALAFFVALFALLWALFADRLVREVTQEAASKALGAEVDIGWLRIRETEAAVELGGFQLADPFDRGRDLVRFDSLRLDLDPGPLVDAKVVVERAQLTGLRFNVPRRTPARVYERGLAQNVMSVVRDFTRQFDVPLLSFTPVDTLQAVVADPSQLRTVQAAAAFQLRADSGKAAVEREVAGLRIGPTLDSTRALADRLARANVRTLGLDGTRRALADLKRGMDSLSAARQRVSALQRAAAAQVDSLQAGLRALEAARQADYAFARSLLKLPSFSGPDLSRALFGAVSIDRFQRALYWTEVARQYAPPGLLPRERPGPARLRRAGTTVHFPVPGLTPGFLVKEAELSLGVGGAESRDNTFRLAARDITSDPALTGRPMTFAGEGAIALATPLQVRLGGALDHAARPMRDSASATLQGVSLPDFRVPGLPLVAGLTPGRATLAFSLAGDQLRGLWSVRTDGVAWRPDSAVAMNPREALAARVLQGVGALDLTARLGGTVSAPTLEVSSNLGDALAGQMRRIVGEEAAKAEARLRAQVDREVGPRVAAARQQVEAVRARADAAVQQAQAELEARRQELQARLDALKVPGLGL